MFLANDVHDVAFSECYQPIVCQLSFFWQLAQAALVVPKLMFKIFIQSRESLIIEANKMKIVKQPAKVRASECIAKL